MPIERYWVLTARKIAGEATPEELEELAALAALREDDARATEMLEKVWEREDTPPPGNVEQLRLLSMLEARLPELAAPAPPAVVRKMYFRPRFVAAVAVLCIGVAAVLFFTFRNGQGRQHEVLADRGARTKVKLPDGTQVWLNAGSRLTYNDGYGHGERAVTLDGEAYFEVVTQADNPFAVTTKAIKLQVLGTTFNLKAYPEDSIVETALVSGSVMLQYKSEGGRIEEALLKPMQKLVLKGDAATGVYAPQWTQISAPQKEMIRETAWKDNWLSFDNEPFSSLAVRLSRWYNVKVVFEDESLRQLTFTGNIQGEGIKDIMDVLSRSSQEFDYSYDHVGRVLTIHKP